MKSNLSQKPGRTAIGVNPLQEKATRNQTPRWSKKQGTPGKEAIPPEFRIRSRVPGKTMLPASGEATEPITSNQTGSYEDEPSQ